MEDYCCELWSAGPWISEEYNYGYDEYMSADPPISEEYNYGYDEPGLHGLVDPDELQYLFENKVNSYHYLGSNDVVSSMNPTNTLGEGEVSTDDYDIIGTNDNVVFLDETKAPFEIHNNYHTNATCTVDQGPDDQSFLDGLEDEVAQLISNQVNSKCNFTSEKPSPTSPLNNRMPHPQLDNDHDFYEAKSSITENAQGLQQPCTRTRKSLDPTKDKSSADEVMKVASAAELNSDQ